MLPTNEDVFEYVGPFCPGWQPGLAGHDPDCLCDMGGVIRWAKDCSKEANDRGR